MTLKHICNTGVAVLFICSNVYAGNPEQTGDVVGRDLAVIGLAPLGHVGVWSHLGEVVEVMNQPNAVQIGTLESFKSKSAYWGAKYYHDSFQNSKALREAAIRQQGHVIYTLTTDSYPAVYSLKCTAWTVPGYSNNNVVSYLPVDVDKIPAGSRCLQQDYITSEGKFRCDTFVKYLYNQTGNASNIYRNLGELAGRTPEALYAMLPKERKQWVHVCGMRRVGFRLRYICGDQLL